MAEVMTPVTELVSRLADLGWKPTVTRTGGAWVAKGEGPLGARAEAQAESEALALVGLLNRARAKNSVLAIQPDPNASYPRWGRRVAALRDDRTPFRRIALSLIVGSRSLLEQPRAAQVTMVEDALRMAGATMDPERARDAAEADLLEGGAGFLFRSHATARGVPPAASSGAWSLLAPCTSQLALPVSRTGAATHWHLERSLRALRHAVGHDDIPLGTWSGALLRSGADDVARAMLPAREALAEACRSLDRQSAGRVAAHLAPVVTAAISPADARKLRSRLAEHRRDGGRRFGKWAAAHVKATKGELGDWLERHDSHEHAAEFRRLALDALEDFRNLPEHGLAGMPLVGD